MKKWYCQKCHTELFYKYGEHEKVILKVCPVCLGSMEVVDEAS